MKIGLVIPTLNAGTLWKKCLAAIAEQSIKPDFLLVIDSSSEDGTVEQARACGFQVKSIKREEFNHGKIRKWAVDQLDHCDVVIFLTQDAILANENALSRLISPFDNPLVAVSYGRQLPHLGAGSLEAHARVFNYGPAAETKNFGSRFSLGAKAFFCSNSFAAYRRRIFIELDGFRENLIFGEDAEFAARALVAGYSNVYCAEALVYHSHDYTWKQTFCRYFDIGVFHARNSWMLEKFGAPHGEGWRFVKSEIAYVAADAPWQIPRSVGHTVAKFGGYWLGLRERRLSKWVKRRLSMMPGYWR